MLKWSCLTAHLFPYYIQCQHQKTGIQPALGSPTVCSPPAPVYPPCTHFSLAALPFPALESHQFPAAPLCPALCQLPALVLAGRTALLDRICQTRQIKPVRGAQGAFWNNMLLCGLLHPASTCLGCRGTTSNALGYKLLLVPSQEEEDVPQTKLRALSTVPLLHSNLCPCPQRSCGGRREGGGGVSRRKPKPGAPGLYENQAQSNVPSRQMKLPQDRGTCNVWIDATPSVQTVQPQLLRGRSALGMSLCCPLETKANPWLPHCPVG